MDSNQAQAEQVKLVIQVVIQKAALSLRKVWESEQANVKCFKTNMCVCGHFLEWFHGIDSVYTATFSCGLKCWT